MKSCCKEAGADKDRDECPQQPEPVKDGWLSRLKAKWQVKNILQVILILCTFALGGSACGYLGRRIMHFIGPDHKVLWVIAYILMVTVLWPVCVLVISIPLGQFRFFIKYLKRLGNRILGRKQANKE